MRIPDAPASGARLLVADDDHGVRELFASLFRATAGIASVIEAEDGAEAVELARGRRFDFAVLDLNMPRLDGLEAARRIREMKGLCEGVPIIALTAFDTYGMREAALEAGCDDYLKKPLDVAELNTVLGRLLPGWRG
jgi:CheY-like chemotaxis protein